MRNNSIELVDYRIDGLNLGIVFDGANVATYFARLVKLNLLVFQAKCWGLIVNVINV